MVTDGGEHVRLELCVVPERAQFAVEFTVVGRNRPGVADGAEVLGRIERKRRRPSERPHLPSHECGPVRLAGVLDDLYAVRSGDGLEGLHVAGLTE